ncbi:hypothetical protein ASE86_14005 [Sphingomonas sp. Leaf33]|uniref:hypothetical protein n=1 Tax=Sphingomonas sp. Leaf33 TaxID=1736215 RepID=UPI0006FDA9CB|nr:hypothetical protein [Sphingomonas sp. Leaf33]KQN19564.1 hypothetical protein ASE86_14005 [Sphingomonas sp. Leaf33]
MSARYRDIGWLLAAMVLVTLPLVWPAIPPLNDLPGHIGRYHIAASIAQSPALQRAWAHDWQLIGNLGVDLPVIALAPWLGVERAAKLVVLLIPAVFVAGLWAIGRSRGRPVPPLAGFACALAYSHAFTLGFVNFALAAALTFVALASWIALDRRPWLRAILFVPVAWLLWIAHSSGWGMFGLMAWASGVMLGRERGLGWRSAVGHATLACLPLATPVLAMTGATGPAADPLWVWSAKASAVASLVRDRWKWFDVASACVVMLLLWTAVRRRDWRWDPVVAAPGAILLLAFVALPHAALGGAYVDMRLLAPACALLLCAVRIDDDRTTRHIALGGVAFLAIRMVATTVSYLSLAQVWTETEAAIPAMPRGARVLSLIREPCASDWHSDRVGHLGGLAIARRDVFENGAWAIPGQQSLRLRGAADPVYRTDPSQLVYPAYCEHKPTDRNTALRDFDRRYFTHVWLVGLSGPVPADLRPVFRNARSTLYRVVR